MKVIGIGGQLGSGKDTLADYITARLTARQKTGIWKRGSFAGAVKKCFCDYFDKTPEFIEEWKRRDEIPPGMAMNVRKSLQFIGDGFRQIQPRVWIETCFRFNEPPFIVSDARYFNEAGEIKKHGGLNILIWRKGWENDDPNPSEAQIKPLVAYCERNFQASCVLPHDPQIDAVEGYRHYDLFVRNETGVEQLFETADQLIVPFIERTYG